MCWPSTATAPSLATLSGENSRPRSGAAVAPAESILGVAGRGGLPGVSAARAAPPINVVRAASRKRVFIDGLPFGGETAFHRRRRPPAKITNWTGSAGAPRLLSQCLQPGDHRRLQRDAAVGPGMVGRD